MVAELKKKKQYTMKISLKIAIIFLILICIFWCILLIQFYRVNYKESRNYAETLSTQTLNAVNRNITTLIDNVSYYSRLIISSSDMVEAMENENIELMRESLHQFISLIDLETNISGIYVTDMNSHVCSIDRSSIRSFRVKELSDIAWFDQVVGLNGSYCLKVNADRVLTQSTVDPMVSLIRAVINPVDFQPVGVLMINIDMDAFVECYADIERESVTAIYVLDDTGKIIVSQSDIKLPVIQKKLLHAEEADGMKKNSDFNMFYESKQIKDTGWKILTGVAIGNIFTATEQGYTIFLAGIEILTIFCLISYFVIDLFVTKPLEKVVGFVNQMKGRRFERMDLAAVQKNSYLELKVLQENYNQMVEEIDLLIDRVYEEERFKRKAEMNALQEQMKPHFLYNTIDAMSYLALSGKNEKLYNALEAFGNYYRILLSKGRETISVKEEIEMIQDYLELQKLRYGEGLKYILDVKTDIYKYHVLKMILQPFVENSINHGIREKGTEGTVKISGCEKNGYLQFCIEDNGIGIEKEMLKRLRNEELEKNNKSFGVRGTIKRMQIYYNFDVNYEIESERGTGTKVILEIPARPEM